MRKFRGGMDLLILKKCQLYPYARSVPSFGLLKPIPILIAHLLLNIKKNKGPIFKFFLMQNQGYIVLLA